MIVLKSVGTVEGSVVAAVNEGKRAVETAASGRLVVPRIAVVMDDSVLHALTAWGGVGVPSAPIIAVKPGDDPTTAGVSLKWSAADGSIMEVCVQVQLLPPSNQVGDKKVEASPPA